ncbi:MAG: hypothetical protein IJY26_01270 [Clostridia bacterium]|nr:hypothetical protein [Clostridia bacterium]
MRIGFLTDGKLFDFEKSSRISRADLYCLAFGSIGEVNYEKEVRGESNELEEVALFSRNFDCTVIAGCYTDTKGIKRKSAVLAERGKILGISDMTTGFDGEKYKCGSGIRVYETSVGKIGVLVGQDIYFPELVKSLAQCGSEQIICMYECIADSLEQILLRANAFCYGVPMCMCAHGYAQIADVSGKLAFATPLSPAYFSSQPVHEYHLIETRLRGFYKPKEMF